MTATRCTAALLAALLAAAPAPAQAERYELGRRLRAYEAGWDSALTSSRVESLAGLPKVTTQFFGLQFGEAGRTLDEARRVLSGGKVTPEVAWSESLYLDPEARLIDARKPGLAVTVKAFYPVNGAPEGATCRVRLGDGDAIDASLAKLPLKLTVPLPKAWGGAKDHALTLGVAPGVLGRCWVGVSVVPDLAARLATLDQAAKAEPSTIEAATLRDRAAMLRQLADGTVFDTDIPAGALLTEAEAVAKLPAGTPYFTAARAGQFRLSVPVARPKGKFDTAPLRLLVPEKLDATKPVPLVVALHGAGGSENLFFEGYGAGHVVKECRQRGWLLVAPRAGLFGAPPVEAIVAELAKRYPIDPKRVFLVGHSMGAGQAAELVQQSPGRYRAVALLGGAARIRDAKAFADLPLFLGVGTKDQLALTGMRALNKTLTAGGAKQLTYREYPEVEHLVVVRESLPDVFAQWDALKRE